MQNLEPEYIKCPTCHSQAHTVMNTDISFIGGAWIEFLCNDCGTRYGYNGSVSIEWDRKPDIISVDEPTITFDGLRDAIEEDLEWE